MSLLTFTCGYQATTLILIGFTLVSLIIEFVWIRLVYNRFPTLRIDDQRKRIERTEHAGDGEAEPLLGVQATATIPVKEKFAVFIKDELATWKDFASMPIFYSGSPDRKRSS